MDQSNDTALEVLPGIFWVGFYEDTTKLQCNPYLLVDGDDVVFFDPGSIPDFPRVMRKVLEVVRPDKITWVVTSHQDPDVCGCLGVLEEVVENPALKIAAHINTVRLIQHLGLNSEFYPVEQNDYQIKLKSGRRLDFIFLPYLHSPGAIATFDHETGTMFTGDLFGAISKPEDIYSAENFPENLRDFHQAYMPSNQVLQRGLDKLAAYPIQQILPQHGVIIVKDQIAAAFAYLRELPCGTDLL